MLLTAVKVNAAAHTNPMSRSFFSRLNFRTLRKPLANMFQTLYTEVYFALKFSGMCSSYRKCTSS